MVAPIFEKAKACGYFKGFDHDSFIVYMRAIVEGPIATSGLTKKLLKPSLVLFVLRLVYGLQPITRHKTKAGVLAH